VAAEDYVHPVTRAREARPAWLDVWPFRVFTLIVVVLIAAVVYHLIFHLHITGAGNSQG
jgi:hypothetical protein